MRIPYIFAFTAIIAVGSLFFFIFSDRELGSQTKTPSPPPPATTTPRESPKNNVIPSPHPPQGEKGMKKQSKTPRSRKVTIYPNKNVPRVDFPWEDIKWMTNTASAREICDYYEKHKADINTSLHAKQQRTLFHFLVMRRYPVAMELYAMGVIEKDKNLSALAAAIISNNIEGAYFFLDEGWPPEGEEPEQMTPILNSVMHDAPELTRRLLAEGANLYHKHTGRNAMDYAVSCKFPNEEILEFLLQSGMPYEPRHIKSAAVSGRDTVLCHILKNRPDLVHARFDDENLLDIAVRANGNLTTIHTLMEQGLVLNKNHLALSKERINRIEREIKNGSRDKNNRKATAIGIHAFIQSALSSHE